MRSWRHSLMRSGFSCKRHGNKFGASYLTDSLRLCTDSPMTYAEQIRAMVARYQAETGVTIYQTHEVARWAIAHRLWAEHPEAAVDRCATAIARALREDKLDNGVRNKHAVRLVQLTLWADMRTASREHMELSFTQRHKQIKADCAQLQADLVFYNARHNPGPPVQLSFDFSIMPVEGSYGD